MTVYEIVAYLGIGLAVFTTFYSLWKARKSTQELGDFVNHTGIIDVGIQSDEKIEEFKLDWGYQISQIINLDAIYYPSGSSYDLETGARIPYTQTNHLNLIRNVSCKYCNAINKSDTLECRKCGAPVW
jgi:hypothetical protein